MKVFSFEKFNIRLKATEFLAMHYGIATLFPEREKFQCVTIKDSLSSGNETTVPRLTSWTYYPYVKHINI
ncbi:MAG: hypothetical protein WBG90_06255 [Saonia sp.]